MENLAISQLPYRNPAQAGDMVPVDKNGETVQVRADSIGALAPNTGNTQIISSAVSGGNPAFFSAGLTSPNVQVNILGATTPLVYFINGVKQTLSQNIPLTVILTGGRLRYIFASKTSADSPGLSDFFQTGVAPFWSYSTPTAPSGTSTTNPCYWFDLSTGTTKKATAQNGAFSLITDSIFLGVVLLNAGGTALEAVLCEPFRLDNQRRISLFGDGSTGTLAVTGATTIQGTVQYRGVFVSGSGAKITKGAGNVGFSLIISQTPIIVTNSGAIGQAGDNGNGGAGQANANGSAGGNGGLAGNGGGGGGAASTRTGGAGGSQNTPQVFSGVNGGGGGGGVGANGVNANGINWTFYDKTFTALFLFNRTGAGGGGGGGNGTGTGGNGGGGGYPVCIVAPAILIDTGCTVSAAGADGAAGGATASGGGGGGGGSLAVLAGGYTVLNGTLTAAGGGSGAGVGGGGNGGTGAAGNTSRIKLW